MMESRYRIAKTRDEVLQVIDYCKTTGYASIDFETTGNNPRKLDFYPTIVGVSFQVGSGWIIPLGHFDSPFKNNWRDILALIGEELWENPAIVKMAWNATFESKVFIHYGYHLRGRLLDGLLAKYLLNEERPHGLKETVDRFLPDFSGYGLETGLGKKASDEAVFNYWSTVPLEELSKYCALDTDTTFRLTLDFENKLITHDLYRLYRNLYMPLVRVFAESTYWGVNIDREYLEWLQGHFKKKIEELEDEILDLPTVHSFNEVYVEEKIEAYIEELQEEIDYGDLSDRQISAREEKISRIEAGEATTKKEQKLLENINLGSPKQLIELLYTHEEGYQFPILERSETGNPSTSESTLLKLLKYDDEGFINKLLEYRGFKKLFSTYVESILTDHLTHEDRIHPSFLLFGTVTSRLSSRNPNLQNIPRGTTNNLIKPMFIPEHPDHLYLEVDGCLTGDTLVVTRRGLIPIKDVKSGDFVLYKQKFYRVKHSYYSGDKAVYKLITNTGNSIKASGNHPFLTPKGFLPVENLKGKVVLKNKEVRGGEALISPMEAYIAGLFYGDGFYSQNKGDNRITYRLSFSVGLDRETLVPILNAFFGKSFFIGRKSPEAVYITDKGIYKDWVKKYPKESSHKMRIPLHIYKASFEIRLAFLGGLIDSDGSVSPSRVTYSSVSEEFIEDVALLGQSVGIYGIKREVFHGGFKKHRMYKWEVFSPQNLHLLYPYINIERKKQHLIALMEDKKRDFSKTSVIPLEAVDIQPKSKAEKIAIKNGKRRGRLTERKVRDLVKTNPEWLPLLDYKYEVVEQVQYVGVLPTYNLEVEEVNAFIANGFLVHNSQMELRVAAELSKDENMIRIFKEGKNIHVQTAALMFELPYDSIQKARKDPNHPEHETMTKKHKSAKILNFTIFYGAGPKKVSEFLTERTGEYHSVEEAKEMIESWFKAFPGAKKWIDRTQKYAKKHGYVKNMFGFKRRLPILLKNPRALPSSERGSYNEALRQSVNSIIQGSASMITLWVLLVAYEYSLTGKLPRYLRMITEVHDSIEYHPHKADAKKVIETLQQIARDLPQMEDYLGATLHKVPMKFSAEIGINWGRMVEADLVKDFEKFYEEEWLKYNKEPYPHINFLSGN